jgi:hypothetical protein
MCGTRDQGFLSQEDGRMKRIVPCLFMVWCAACNTREAPAWREISDCLPGGIYLDTSVALENDGTPAKTIPLRKKLIQVGATVKDGKLYSDDREIVFYKQYWPSSGAEEQEEPAIQQSQEAINHLQRHYEVIVIYEPDAARIGKVGHRIR